jgi:hypothetical protein
MNSKSISFASLALLSCLFADQSLAATSIPTAAAANSTAIAAPSTSMQEFQLAPAFDLWGYTGKHTVGDAQGLVPLIGDQNKVFYVAAEGKIASKNNGWMAGGGAGYRQVIDQRILGGYVVADHNNALDSRRFWVINPGIESLGMTWDFRVNGYFPTKRTWDEHDQFVDFEDHCGIYDHVRFEGHKQFDRQALVTKDGEIITGLGADAEIGRTIPLFDNLKGFVGGYYFNNKDAGHVGGGSARITWQATNNLGVEVIDTYDNQRHNTALVGIKLSLSSFGKDDVKKFGIDARLMDPIEHNIATAANGYTVPVMDNTKIRFHPFGAEILEHDNIWFFKQGAAGTNGTTATVAAGDGTFENPFIGFNQPNVTVVTNNFGSIGAIKDRFPLLYFAPGTYSLTGQGFANIGRFSLPLGWGMFGRNAGYNAPAFGDERALFEGGIDIMPATALQQGASDNSAFVTTLNSIHVLNDVAVGSPPDFSNSTVFIQNAGTVIIQNSMIESHVSAGKAVGLSIENAVLTFEKLDCKHDGDTLVNGTGSTEGDGIVAFALPTIGNSKTSPNIASVDGATINFNGGNNTISGTGQLQGFGVLGLFALGTNAVNFNGGVNSIIAESTGTSASSDGIGITVSPTLSGTNANFALSFNGGINNIQSFSNSIGTSTGINISAGSDVSATQANVQLLFNGGLNVVTGSSTAFGSGIQMAGATDNGAQVNMNLIFSGGTNLIQANGSLAQGISISPGGSAANTVLTTVDFDGGENTVSVNSSSLLGVGIGVGPATSSLGLTTINFNGGTNNIIVEGLTAFGLAINSQNTSKTFVNFNGGVNAVSANALTGSAVGINIVTLDNAETDITFNGGTNNVNANGATGVGIGAFSDIQGITNITFNNGNNTVAATGAAGGQAFDVSTRTNDNGVVNIRFNNFNNPVNFIANLGSDVGTRNGINAKNVSNNTFIFDENGIAIRPPATATGPTNSISSYVKFITSTNPSNPDASGLAVVWGNDPNASNWSGLWTVE